MKKNILKYWKSVIYLLVVSAFCFSAYKVISLTLKAKGEQDTFSKLAAIVFENESANGSGKSARDNKHAGNSNETGAFEKVIKTKDILPQYKLLYEQNKDFYGWISIENTPINYPVMYTPQESEYYLRRDFYKNDSQSGTPFLDGECQSDGSYLLIYGHNMKNNTMFGSLTDYADMSFCKEHSVICFDTCYEQRVYEVFATFYSQLDKSDEKEVFRYYDYKDLSDSDVFEEYIAQVKAYAIYDTGVNIEFGDQILVLSTCSYHRADGRFVVVAKRVS